MTAINKPGDETTRTTRPAADLARTGTQAPVPVVTILEPVRLFSPLVAAIAFAVSGPALFRAFVTQTEPIANALVRVLVAWVIVWCALWVLHLLIGPVSPRQSSSAPAEQDPASPPSP